MLLTNFWVSRVFLYVSLLKLILVFGGVAFFTLLERKILSYRQNRKGPKKVRFLGVLQPVSDAIKLIIKSFGFLVEVRFFEFFIFPLLALVIMCGFWIFYTPYFSYFRSYLGVFLIFLLLSLRVFPVLGSGWASKRKYAVLGAVRGAAQRVSYEVILIFSFIWVIFCYSRKSFFLSTNFFLFLIFFVFFLVWLVSIIAETNRSPFDFAEGERELVSGFKIEYGSFPFALLFLSEYGVIIFFSRITGFYFSNFFLFIFFGFFISLIFLWVRRSFPRFRYDMLMVFCWQVLMFFIFGVYFLIKFF